MRTDNPLLSAAVIALGAAIQAQNPPIPENVIGTSRAVEQSRLLRPDAMPSPGGTANIDVLNRLDPRDHTHYFDNGIGDLLIGQMQLAIHDANDQTTEDWSAVWYDEDPARPGHPNAAGPMLRLGPIPMPPPWNPQQPAVTWYIGLGFGPAWPTTNNQTLFYGVGLPPAPNQSFPNDGLSLLALTDDPNDSVHDVPGRAIGNLPHGTYSVWTLTMNGLPSAPSSYLSGSPGSRTLLYCDMGGVGCGGTPIAITNQQSFWVSNPGNGATGQGGTSSPFSGLHPDVFGWNAGRADDLGFLLYDQQMIGNVAIILASFGTTAPLPVGLIPGLDPNSFGVQCIDAAASTTFLAIIDQNGFAQANLPLTQPARAFVQNSGGFDLVWQGFAADVSGPLPRVHLTGCARQHL